MTVSGTITVTASASDDVAVGSVVFQVDGRQIGAPVTASPYAVSLNTTQLSNGHHTLTAVATDLAGNRAQASVGATVQNTGPGDTPPTIAITTPTSGATVSGTITVRATASDDIAVSRVVFQVDGRPFGSPVTAPPYAVSLNTTQLNNGQHTLAAVATDPAGNSAQASATVMVKSSTPPAPSGVLSIISPQAGSTVSGQILILGTVADAVLSIQVEIDSAKFGSHKPSTKCNLSWAERDHLLFQCPVNTTLLSDGGTHADSSDSEPGGQPRQRFGHRACQQCWRRG